MYTPHVTMNITDDETWYPVIADPRPRLPRAGRGALRPQVLPPQVRALHRRRGPRQDLEIIGWTENDTAINAWSRMNLYDTAPTRRTSTASPSGACCRSRPASPSTPRSPSRTERGRRLGDRRVQHRRAADPVAPRPQKPCGSESRREPQVSIGSTVFARGRRPATPLRRRSRRPLDAAHHARRVPAPAPRRRVAGGADRRAQPARVHAQRRAPGRRAQHARGWLEGERVGRRSRMRLTPNSADAAARRRPPHLRVRRAGELGRALAAARAAGARAAAGVAPPADHPARVGGVRVARQRAVDHAARRPRGADRAPRSPRSCCPSGPSWARSARPSG